MPEDDVIIIKEGVKVYGKQTVLKGISLNIKKGEIFGLLGPSGAGKTTLVKQLVGLEAVSEGEVRVLNQKQPSLEVIEQIGYMAQSDALYTELSARENLEFFAALYSLSRKERRERIQAVMETVDLTEAMDKIVSQFSGGMKRRLSLAIAMLHEPQVLILDEPTVGMDPILRKSIWQNFEKLKQSGVTILVTTHVMDEAGKCDRLGMIRGGRLTAVGSPFELKKEAQTDDLEAAFLVYGGEEHAG
ncbi:ABC transporter, ATP-binding protein [Alkalibacterium sp. AK22]|uniref:ABC transporter ATP-binding protein n=1 Tax=Alkalibacterium sp. AK22 TaxID=1229520 RepID=UPI00044D01F5|nr:ABC transporter ATP-binding protein [Alkalibacterium sp. AK22]EXJ24384.1 ABC transporter, ATP-binding protein [Alkalibacterium sp. AK22]